MKYKDKQFLTFTTIIFLIGACYYWLFRNNILITEWLGIKMLNLNIQFKIDWLPSFIHQFVFIIFTWFALDKKHKCFAISIWLILNLSFEILQALPLKYVCFLPKILIEYSQYGTYSNSDIVAILFASIMAGIVIKLYIKGE